MWPGVHAADRPDQAAVVMAGSGDTVTYAELEERSRRLARVWEDAGLGFGDHVALLVENQPRFFEVCWAAQRSGLYYTAINTHLTAEEVAYIVDDCDAKAFVTSAGMSEVAAELVPMLPDAVTCRLVMDGPVDGYTSYEDALASVSGEPRDDEIEGHAMLYSSGTTGRPKGVRFELQHKPLGEPGLAVDGFRQMYKMGTDTVYLSTAPNYHAAPLQFCMAVHRLGGTAVVMERFDEEAALVAIERHRVTHSQWVPTMFVRLFKLPEEVRERYDLSSQHVVLHAAAPCPIPVKEKMIEWWGPIVSEYYSSTEAIGATMISSAEWLEHKGSVGRPWGSVVHICDDDGNDVPLGEVGVVWFESPVQGLAFEYHNDPAKTASSHDERGWATNWDMGRLDEDGYLYLTDRKDFMIVSGGVNIYPQEAEDVLITHPAVADAAVFGVPDQEMGEQVKGVVQPAVGAVPGPELEQELLAHCRSHLASYKCPKSIDFEEQLPRLDTGKLYKRLLRDRYWGEGESRIGVMVRYQGMVYDSARWEGFETRPSDIFICTPPKCGTTWMQMIVALLVFQEPELPDLLSRISPWIDMTTRPRREVFDDLAAQEHRRFIKTHTPLDGLPEVEDVTYVVVGRDPRDVALSMANHAANLDVAHLAELRARSAEVDGVELEPLVPPPPPAEDPVERFWQWVGRDADPTTTVSTLGVTVAHLHGFWDARDRLDVVLFHYDDLLADLDGEMRRLADHLGISVPEDRWPALVEAATLDAMRARSADVVPGADRGQWKDTDRFFNKGTSGQWRDLLDDDGVRRYAERVRSLAPADLVEWLHHADPLPDA